ncbi:hypothetical protein Tco_0178070 [Tanacetum coccineum]
MSSDFAHSTVSYTSISSNDPSWGIPAMDPYKEVAHQVQVSPPLSPEYVTGPEHPPSPNYVPGPEHPPSPDYVPGPEYPGYLIPSYDEVLIKDQSLPADASTTALSLGYVADSDPEEDPADYPIDVGYEEEEEFYEDDADDKDEEDASEEEEHLDPANSSTIPIDDPIPSTEETEPFETDESAPTPPSPRLSRARRSVRPQTPIAAATEALIAAVAATLPSSSPPDSPLTPLSSPLPQIPSPPLPLPAPSSPLLLPATDHREDVPEADLPLQKRLCLTAPASRFEVGRVRIVDARHHGLDVTACYDYSFIDIWMPPLERLGLERLAIGLWMFRDDMVGIWERGEHRPL